MNYYEEARFDTLRNKDVNAPSSGYGGTGPELTPVEQRELNTLRLKAWKEENRDDRGMPLWASGAEARKETKQMSNLNWVVRGDFRRIEYSRHRTRKAAERSARQLAEKWGWCHLGSEPIVRYEGPVEG